MIEYVSKQRMKQITGSRHYYGYAYPSRGQGYVLESLPKWVRQSVEAHERYHLEDRYFYDRSEWGRELEAFLYQTFHHPIGTLLMLVMSIHPARLRLMVRRMAAMVKNHNSLN